MSEQDKQDKLQEMIETGEAERNPEAYAALFKTTELYKMFN